MAASNAAWKLQSPFRTNALDLADQRHRICNPWAHFNSRAVNGRESFVGVSFYRFGCDPVLNGRTRAFSMCRRGGCWSNQDAPVPKARKSSSGGGMP